MEGLLGHVIAHSEEPIDSLLTKMVELNMAALPTFVSSLQTEVESLELYQPYLEIEAGKENVSAMWCLREAIKNINQATAYLAFLHEHLTRDKNTNM